MSIEVTRVYSDYLNTAKQSAQFASHIVPRKSGAGTTVWGKTNNGPRKGQKPPLLRSLAFFAEPSRTPKLDLKERGPSRYLKLQPQGVTFFFPFIAKIRQRKSRNEKKQRKHGGLTLAKPERRVRGTDTILYCTAQRG